MRTFNEWNNRKSFHEFVGPAGQVDPQNLAAQMPTNDVQALQKRLLNLIANQAPQQINQFKQQLNQQIDQVMHRQQATQQQGQFNPMNRQRPIGTAV